MKAKQAKWVTRENAEEEVFVLTRATIVSWKDSVMLNLLLYSSDIPKYE